MKVKVRQDEATKYGRGCGMLVWLHELIWTLAVSDLSGITGKLIKPIYFRYFWTLGHSDWYIV